LRLGRNRKDFGPLRQGIAVAGYQRPLGFEGDRWRTTGNLNPALQIARKLNRLLVLEGCAMDLSLITRYLSPAMPNADGAPQSRTFPECKVAATVTQKEECSAQNKSGLRSAF